MTAQRKFEVNEVIANINELRGNVSAVAIRMRTSRNTLYKYINSHSQARKALNDARETMLDHAESILYTKVLDGDSQSLIFFLRTQGKNRGYVERQELSGSNNEPVKITVVYPDDND